MLALIEDRQLSPELFVIGIEANPKLVYSFEVSPYFEGYRDRALVFHGAVGTKTGIVRFNPGYGFDNISDTGSLFHWNAEFRERERRRYVRYEQSVRMISIEQILQHVPLPNMTANGTSSLIWDTLKIDVQGADVDALHSVGSEFIKHFLCVVGEFQIDEYSIPKDFPIDPKPFLTKNGFQQVYQGQNQIWLNIHHIEIYRKNPKRFSCHRVYDSLLPAQLLLDAFDRKTVSTISSAEAIRLYPAAYPVANTAALNISVSSHASPSTREDKMKRREEVKRLRET
jgi:hypothetical protein